MNTLFLSVSFFLSSCLFVCLFVVFQVGTFWSFRGVHDIIHALQCNGEFSTIVLEKFTADVLYPSVNLLLISVIS